MLKKTRAKILGLYLVASIMITAIIQSVSSQPWEIDLLIGLSIFLVLGIYTYVLERVALRPAQKDTERQRRFAGNVAHELRTPLSVMKTNFEVALMGADGEEGGAHAHDAELPDVLRGGIEEIDRMSAVTQFLLAFSALDTRRMEVEFSDVDLAEVVRETIHRMQPLIENREVNVRAMCPAPVVIRGNATSLGEMLMNLIKNSIAYTPVGGSVVVTAKREGKISILSISDTGIGIPPSDVSNIFEPFYRGENAYSQRNKKRGNGLGLAIVKEIVEFHKDNILVESELGKGTTISVRFPVAARLLAIKKSETHASL